MNNILKMAAVATFTLTALSAQAKSAEPAVIYDTAGKFDKSFNEAVFRGGVEAFDILPALARGFLLRLSVNAGLASVGSCCWRHCCTTHFTG